MPLPVSSGAPTLFIRRTSYERSELVRAALDERLGLTPDEFRVDGSLVAIGPIFDEEAFGEVTDALEKLGLVYFEDFFELSGNWPAWLTLLVTSDRS